MINQVFLQIPQEKRKNPIIKFLVEVTFILPQIEEKLLDILSSFKLTSNERQVLVRLTLLGCKTTKQAIS